MTSERETLHLVSQLDSIAERGGVLPRNLHDNDGHVKQLLAVPSSLYGEVLKAAHTDFGHQGPERTKKVMQQHCSWPGMYMEVKQWVSECEWFVIAKGP